MLSTLNRLNHHALKFNADVANIVETICEPLLKNFGITNFGYVKIFKDGTMLRISADREWTVKYFDSQYYNDDDFYDFSNMSPNSSRIKIYTNKPEGGVYSALYDHNIWNIYTKYERNEDTAEVWFFATDRENTGMINFYINHADILASFMQYFKEKAAHLLTIKNREILIATELKIHNTNTAEEQQFINEFTKKIKHSRVPVMCGFTPREIECVQHVITGKSAKETAQLLNLSPRTVEQHLSNIKRKAGCKKTSQLLKMIFDEK